MYGYFPTYQPQYVPQFQMQPPMPDQLAQLRQQVMPLQQNAPQQGTMPNTPQQGQPSAMSGPVFVSGEAGARGFMVAAGNTVMLIDADPDANTFWLKSADASGMPSMRTFDYTERISSPRPNAPTPSPEVEYVPRADFEALKNRCEAVEKELEAIKPKKPKKEDKDNE